MEHALQLNSEIFNSIHSFGYSILALDMTDQTRFKTNCGNSQVIFIGESPTRVIKDNISFIRNPGNFQVELD